MVDSEEFPLDPNITTDCFWDAVSAIEEKYSSSDPPIHTASNQNNSGLKPTNTPLSNVTNNMNPNTNPTRPKQRLRSSSTSSISSNSSSNSSNSNKKRKSKFKCPKPLNTNTTYYKQYAQKYNQQKAKTPPNPTNNNKQKPIGTKRPNLKPRNRNPLLLSQTNSLHNGHSDISAKIETKSNSYHSLHSKPINTSSNGSTSNSFHSKPTNISSNSNKSNQISTNISSNSNTTLSNVSISSNYNDTPSYSSYRSNNVFSASCTAESISRINVMDNKHDSDGFVVPMAPSRRKIESKMSSPKKSDKTAITAKLIQCKKEMARLRREKRQNEERLKADVEIFKRRTNDYQKETFKLKDKLKLYQTANHDKYNKQFETLRSQIKELQIQRDAKEREVVEYCNKNRDLSIKLHKEKDSIGKWKDQYAKLYNKLSVNKQMNEQLTTQIISLKEKVQSPINNKRKRKLDESNVNPKKRMKLSVGKEIECDLDMFNDNNDDDISMTVSYRRGSMNKFKDKESIIEYEMNEITQLLICEMSGDPLDELGIFIQSLSINNKISDNKHYEIINKEREKWQKLLNENWFLSKQTNSLIPLIRFLYSLLSQNDFNHILQMRSAIKILQIIFDGNNGSLYRKMLFESVLQENNKKNERKKKDKTKKKRKKKSLLEKMMARNGLNHHLLIIERKDCDDNNKEESDDVEMKDVTDKHKKDNNNGLSMKGRLPNVPFALIEILRVIQTHILRVIETKKKIAPKQRVFIANSSDLTQFSYESSLLEYRCLLLFYTFLFYAQSNIRMNLILCKLILNNIQLIIGVLCCKKSTLKSKIICIKILVLLLQCSNKKYCDSITEILIQPNEYINCGRMDDAEPTLLYYALESLFCCSQFDLFEVDEINKNDILSMCLDIVLYRQQIIKFISSLICHKNKRKIFHEKIIKYYFNFKYNSFKLLNNDRIKTKLHQTKKPFFYLLSQLIIYLNSIQNGDPTDILCPQFKNQQINTKYQHLLDQFNQKVINLIHFVKEKVCEKEEKSKIAQINRDFIKKMNKEEKEIISANKNEKGEIIINSSSIPQEIKDLIQIYVKNVLERDSFYLLSKCLNNNQSKVLTNERDILMTMMLKLMLMLTEIMENQQIKSSLKHQEFEIMKVLNDKRDQNEYAKDLYHKFNQKIHIFADKYDDDN